MEVCIVVVDFIICLYNIVVRLLLVILDGV